MEFFLYKFISMFKRVAFHVLVLMPVVKNYHRFRNKLDLIPEAAALLERFQAYRTLDSVVLYWRLRWLGINIGGLKPSIRRDIFSVLSGQYLVQELRSLEDRLENIAPSDLPCEQWLVLHNLFCFRGLYVIAQTCREHARKIAILPFFQHDARPPISWINSIAAALEGGECNDHSMLDSILEKAKIMGPKAAKWHLLLSVLNGERVLESKLAKLDNSGFSEFIKSKNVALVGPVPTQVDDALNIDSNDVVIRLNHSFSGKGTDSIHKGLRTDVSYFNGGQTKAITKLSNGILPPEISWGCFKFKDQALEIQQLNVDKKCRAFGEFNGMTFYGSYNMVPLAALDLTMFDCHSVKIFHVDMMLTASRYQGYYPRNSISYRKDGDTKQRFLRGSIVHCPVLQYRTLHRLWENKKIYGDKSFQKVMAMGLNEYLKELEQVYSDKVHVVCTKQN